MRIIAVANQKGGGGKTTTTFNLGHGLAKRNNKVLLIDLDPQRNLTIQAGLGNQDKNTTTDIFEKSEVIPTYVDGISVIPTTRRLSGVETALSNVLGREFILKEAVEKIASDFDYIIIDCPSRLGILAINALIAAREILIPTELDQYSLQGIVDLTETIEKIKKVYNHNIIIAGILPFMVNSRRVVSRAYLDSIEKVFPGSLCQTQIRVDVSCVEAVGHRKNIFDYQPNSHGAMDYNALTTEIVGRDMSNTKTVLNPVEQLRVESLLETQEGTSPLSKGVQLVTKVDNSNTKNRESTYKRNKARLKKYGFYTTDEIIEKIRRYSLLKVRGKSVAINELLMMAFKIIEKDEPMLEQGGEF